LTPEKFDKLIGDILSVDLSSTDILKGVIILIFEKALYEPKYSSMYAQLCKRLDEKSPVDPNRNITIFKFHLLNQCKEEFENRSKANITFENGYEPSEEELEAKFLAKRKMLGNIKFIGELGKLQIVQDRILHMCCEALVLGWKNKPLSEREEDLECLCHLMRTCGRILDTPNGKYRMDQYFERMDQVIESAAQGPNKTIPLRIRFMIQDITELRRNKWMPRRAGKDPERGPRTIQQVREDAARDGFIYMPQESTPPEKMSPAHVDLMYGGAFDGVFNRRAPDDDFFGGFGGGGSGMPSTTGGPLPPSMGGGGSVRVPGSGSTASPAGYLTGGYLGTGASIAAAAAGYGNDDDDIPGFPASNKGPSRPAPQPSNQQQQQPMVLTRQPRTPSMAMPEPSSRTPPPAAAPQTSSVPAPQAAPAQAPPMQQQQAPPPPQQQALPAHHQRHRYNDLQDEPVNNNSSDFMRKHSEGDIERPRPLHQERGDYDGRRRGGGGGGFNRGGPPPSQNDYQPRGGQGPPRDRSFNDEGSQNGSSSKPAPPPDFGDRYSANRSRDQQRREQQRGGDWGGRGGFPDHRGEQRGGGGRGGYNNRGGGGGGRFDNYRNNNSNNGMGGRDPMQQGPPPRFGNNREDRFDSPSGGDRDLRGDPRGGGPPPNRFGGDRRGDQGPPRGDQMAPPPPRDLSNSDDSNLNNMAPRFNKKLSFNNGPPGGAMPPPSYQPGYGGRQSGPQDARQKDVELSLRPASGNMLFKPKTPSLLPKSAIGRDGSSPLGENSLLGPSQGQPKVMMQQKEANILIKQGSLDGRAKKEKNRQAANKGPTREEVFSKVNGIVDALLRPVDNKANDEGLEDSGSSGASNNPLEAVAAAWIEDGWLPSKMTQTAVTHLYNVVLAEEVGESRSKVMALMLTLIKDKSAIDGTHCREAFTKVLNTADKEASKNGDYEDKAAAVLAELAAWKVSQKLASLDEIGDCVSSGLNSSKLRKILLQTMSLLASTSGSSDDEDTKAKQEAVLGMFNESKILLKDHVDEEEQKDEAKLAQVLASYKLSFLKPMLFIRQDMIAHVLAHPDDPEALLSWINDNVSQEFLSQPDFVIALFSVVLGHIVESTTLPKGQQGQAQAPPDKSLVEAEKDKLAKFRGVLHSFVASAARLQLTAVYALQVFCHGLGFPKGLLLRVFVNCYELDILDEHAFLQWKEDVNDFYPGKGQALFQVNQWLTWLEEAESEEEEDDD